MTSSNSERRKPGPKPQPDKKGRWRKASSVYRENERQRKAYMQQVTNAAERLQEALESCPLGQITLPLDFVASTAPETLDNLAAIIEAQQEPKMQQGRKRKTGR